MKTTFISLMALGVAAAAAGPADRASADEPMVLTDAQLDRVTGQKYLTVKMTEVFVTSVQTSAEVPDRASQNDNFLAGFTFDPSEGVYVKSVPEGDRPAR